VVSVETGGGGSTVVTGGGAAVVVGTDRVVVVRGESGVCDDVVVCVVSVDVDVELETPYEPLYCHCPRHETHVACVFGSGNGTSARLPIAVSMYVCQICAGKVAPETAMPCTLSIGISPLG
jgi:hypothetical protein